MPTVRTNGVETYYERSGEGPPVVFVHGAILDHSQWDPQVEALSDRYETIAYDVRGHGRTGGSSRERYSIELFADDLAALLDELDVERPVLCGHSMGGCIAQVYAARHPDALAGLVLSSTFGPPTLSRAEWLQRSVLLRATIPPVRVLGYERVERWMIRLTELFQEGAAGEYGNVERLREDGPPMATAEFAKVIRAVASFRDAAVDPGTIDVPTLVIYGEDEPGFVRQHAARFAATIPDATVEVISGAGHASNLDDPGRYVEVLEAFLERATRGGGTDEGTTEPSTGGDGIGSDE